MRSTKIAQEINRVAETSIDEGIWQRINTAIAKSEREISMVHCHIPVCIGYKGGLSAEELAATIDGVIKKKYDYTIYLAPRDQSDGDLESPLVAWKRENAELLKRVPSNKIIKESEWRGKEIWKKAAALYAQFEQKKTDTIKGLLEKDVISKKKTPSFKDVSEEAIASHMIQCAIDCLSWMQPQQEAQENSVQVMNVLLYHHPLTQVMHNMLLNAGTIGYVPNSLIHVKPRYNRNVQQNVSKVDPVLCAEPEDLSLEARDFISSVALQLAGLGVDPRYLGRVLATLYLEISKQPTESKRIEVSKKIGKIDSDKVDSSPKYRRSTSLNFFFNKGDKPVDSAHTPSSSPARFVVS
ncbi:MAG: hypothetical protein KIT56_02330 [Gammaproteobacteria bacterium]|nr:hypothetical protein [Gammaproteobacteria bacterium]MCW5582716.1 hypothetical protein [Gammaproteobacteria bacterium]